MHAELSNLVVRDVRDRGREIEGCIKQWFSFVKPNFHRYVEPQRLVSGMWTLECIPLTTFRDDQSNIVHLNTIEEQLMHIFRSYLILSIFNLSLPQLAQCSTDQTTDIIVPRGIENKVAISKTLDCGC